MGDILVPALPEREALRAVMAEFAGSIAEGRAPLTGGQHGMRVLALLEAASRSLELGGTVVDVAPRRCRSR
jgi:predicted dehydrogenase